MDLNVKAATGGEAGAISVSEKVFGAAYKPALVHQVVTAYLAGARAGTRAQKSRSSARGGGAKPWRQKGTGRARAGTSRSPIWRSGGVTFAARPQNFSQKVNRKMYRGALRSILSEMIRQDRLVAVDEFGVEAPKTKQLVAKLTEFGLKDVFLVCDSPDENLYLAARNLHSVDVRDVSDIDPVSLMGFDKIMVTSAALKHLEERLA